MQLHPQSGRRRLRDRRRVLNTTAAGAQSARAPAAVPFAGLAAGACGPWTLIGFNVALLLAACGAGWMIGATAVGPSQTFMPASSSGADTDFSRDVAVIVNGNLRVILTILLGSCTLGVLSAMVIIRNGFTLGFGLAVLVDESPGAVTALMRYLPFEFTALVLASASAMLVSRWILGVLLAVDRPALRSAGYLLIASLVFLLVAAVIEVGVKRELAGI